MSPLRAGWRFLVSKVIAIGLILLLGALTLVGTLIPQLPDAARGDALATAAWVDGIRPRFGAATDWMWRLQAFTVFHSLTFTCAAAVLGLSTLACTVNRSPALWRQVAHPPRHAPGHQGSPEQPAHRLVVAASPAEVAGHLEAWWRDRRYRIVTVSGPDTIDVYAVRHRFSPLATVVAHAGLVLLLAAAALTSQLGFRDPEVAVVIGERHMVGHDTGMVVEAVGFTDSYTETGVALDYASELVLLEDGMPVARQTVRVNEPLRHGGLSVYQSFYGIAAVVRVADPTGTTVFEGGVPLKWAADDGIHTVGLLDLPEQRAQFAVLGTVSGKRDPMLRAGQVQVVVHRDGVETARRVVSSGTPATIDGLTVTFLREKQFTGLTVARDPGSVWVWLGALLVLAGMSVTFYLRQGRLWARVQPLPSGSRVLLGASGRTAPSDLDGALGSDTPATTIPAPTRK